MKKLLTLTLVVLTLVFVLASCGGKQVPPTTTTTTQPPVHIHNYGEWEVVKNPTCVENGEKVCYCSCGEKQSEVILALGHNPAEAIEENCVEATCYAVGSYDMVVYCSECKAELERASYTLSKVEHTPAEAVEENRVNPTHENDGSYQMVVYCSVAECHAELERTTHTLDMLVHHPGNAVVENEVAATCTQNGSYDEVVYCLDDDCGHKELSRKTISVPMIAHTPAEAVEENRVEATCTQNGKYDEVIYCVNCRAQMSRTTKVIDPLGHTESDWIVDVEATTTTEGSKHTECTVCGEVIKTETIEKLPRPASEGLEFDLNYDGQSYYVKSIGTCTDTDIVIPETYNGLPVTRIDEWAFMGCRSVTSIFIPAFVRSIPTTHGFDGCQSLTSIEVDENNAYYESIDGNLYYKNDKTLIMYAKGKKDAIFVIPDSVTSINDFAFTECFSLTSVTMPDSVTSIGVYAFYNCSSLTSITIGDSVTRICDWAFANCSSLASLEIPDSVTYIGEYAFYGCSSLTSIEIPDSVTSIGYRAFAYCTSLTSIVIPDSVTSIGESAFYECTSLTIYCEAESKPSGWDSSWNYSSRPVVWGYSSSPTASEGLEFTLNSDGQSYSVTGIGTCTDNDIVIPETYEGLPVTSIGHGGAFQYCYSLTSIVIPDSVTSIGWYAFNYCSSLTSVAFGENSKLTSIGRCAFQDCSSLTSIEIPDSVTSIGEWAFCNCSSLTSIVIPYSVTSIGSEAFYNCLSLTIYCEATSEPIGWDSSWNYLYIPVVWGYKPE